MINSSFPIFRALTVGHGVDLVDIKDFSRLLKKPAIDHLNQYFTQNELASAGEGATRLQRLAGRFAVKEAVMKALGTGWGNGVTFTDVEVVNLASGQPTVLLHRNLAIIMQQHEITGWLVSVSHTTTLAFASVIAIKDQDNITHVE